MSLGGWILLQFVGITLPSLLPCLSLGYCRFVRGLALLHKEFRGHMMSANRAHEKQVISEEMLRVILSNIGSLYTINTGLLAELEKRIASWYVRYACMYNPWDSGVCLVTMANPSSAPSPTQACNPYASSAFCSLAIQFFALIHNPVQA